MYLSIRYISIDEQRRIEHDERGEARVDVRDGRHDTERNVGSTPLIVHGWRPYSATIQPSSQATHGSGMLHTARRSSQRCGARLRSARKKNDAAKMNRNSMPKPDHDPEAPEQRRHLGNRVVGGRLLLLGRRVDDVGRVLLEQQAEAEVLLVLFEQRARLGAPVAAAQLLQLRVGDAAALDPLEVVCGSAP